MQKNSLFTPVNVSKHEIPLKIDKKKLEFISISEGSLFFMCLFTCFFF